MTNRIKIIGGGLAGSDAAYYLAKKGYDIRLYDLKPDSFTPAHHNPDFGELVCSNSLKSNDVQGNACGLLKEELRILGSMVIASADHNKVPAGNSLSVNRELFAKEITENLKSMPNIRFVSENVKEFDLSENVIVATGPLTTPELSKFISELTGTEMYFFDAAAPIISADSVDMNCAYYGDRYGEPGIGDYINCPLDKAGYENFYNELVNAKRAELHDFENGKVFEGCMPVEVMAARGVDTLRFGPLKPVGLTDPKTGVRPYACLQLRKEDAGGTMYNLVGFQTNLTFSEQKRVFSIFPALKNAEYYRYGVMHRNSYIRSPGVLKKDFSMIKYPNIFFAGQIAGVEGYVESAAGGLLSAINMDRRLSGKESVNLDNETVLGALASYCETENPDFQPMNANFGILAPLNRSIKDKTEKKRLFAERALEKIKAVKEIL